MKIAVKIPNDSRWPAEYWDKVVDIEVVQIKFSSGAFWSCEGFPAELEFSKENKEERKALVAHFGQKMKSLSVEFANE